MGSGFGSVRIRLFPVIGALFVVACGCGSHKKPNNSASSGGCITIENRYPGVCILAQSKPEALSASLDGGPVVEVAGNAKFQFANVAAGDHTICIYIQGKTTPTAQTVWKRALRVSPGGSYGIEITCNPDGSARSSGPTGL